MRQLILVFFIVSYHVAAQEDTRYRTVMDKLARHYNQEAYDSIFFMLAPSMQQHLPQAENKKFFTALHGEAGKLVSWEALAVQSQPARFKTVFQQQVFALNIYLNEQNKISGFEFKPFGADELVQLEKNLSSVELPFRGQWTVFWGGDTPEQNYHVENRAQRGAFDFLIIGENGKSYRTNGRSNEDFYAFGKEILAPVDGVIAMVVDGIKDNVPGEMNPVFIPGNTIIVKTEVGEFYVLAHFKQHSIVVKEGDKVNKGQLLGQCGNSGNSTEPHLHMHLQNVEEMYKATGAKIYFEKLLVNGVERQQHSPIKGEVVGPVK
ncbi:MAG TPA: peptidoglycan DD-metalloendopeptidase family protein [Cyclobacteriaceae bacterium]|nr:peptidoglycan DD-metalloendopeptidase family protein [Cyclobacteriaceae bacterium]